MRIALLLIGRLDSFVKDYDSLKEIVLDRLSPDIFFSGHPNKEGIDYCREKVEELWKPKKYILREYTEEVRKEVHPNDARFDASYVNPPISANILLSVATTISGRMLY